MLKDIILNARKTIPPPPVYFNELWGTGLQNYPLGDNSNINRSLPIQIGNDTDWSYICSGETSFAIKTSGSLWGWGANDLGQLGINTSGPSDNRSSPVQIGNLTNWKKVIAGYDWALALKTDGTLWGWGANTFGQLGLGDVVNRSSPVQIGTGTDWSEIGHNFAIKTNGTLWAWGSNTFGELGLSESNIVHNKINKDYLNLDFTTVDIARNSGFGIGTNGTLWGWGANDVGQLGDNSTSNRTLPVKIGIDTDWKTVKGSTSESTLGTEVHTLAIKTDGTLWAWGSNTRGQLGLLTTVNRSEPVKVGADTNWSKLSAGSSFTIAIKNDGTLWSWGNNATGRLGLLLTATANRSSPVQIGTRSDWTQISSGFSHTIALRSNNTLWAWGGNTNTQLGISVSSARSSPVQVGARSDWTQVAAGGINSYGIRSDGTLWAWGANGDGQLGRNNTLSQGSPVQVGTRSDWTQVKSGTGNSVLAIRSDNTLWGWGLNTSGQLGDGTTTTRSSPVQIGTLSNWVSGSVGAVVTAIMDNGTYTYTSGQFQPANALARPGRDQINRSSPVQVGTHTNWSKIFGPYYQSFLKTDGSAWTLRSSPVQIGTDMNWRSLMVDADQESTNTMKIGIKTDGTLWSWGGNNFNGTLGVGDTLNRSVPTQIGTDNNWSHTTQLLNYNISAVKTNGTLWAWGANDGQLGLGDMIRRSSPTQVGSLSTWVSASQFSIITHYIKRYT